MCPEKFIVPSSISTGRYELMQQDLSYDIKKAFQKLSLSECLLYLSDIFYFFASFTFSAFSFSAFSFSGFFGARPYTST